MRIKWNKVCKAPGTYQYPGKSNNIQPSLIHFINISRSFQKPGSPHPTLIPSDQPIISSHRTTATAFYLISLWHFYSILTPPPHSSQNDLSNLRNLIILLTRHPSVVSNCSQDKLYIPCQSPQGPASLFLAHAIPSAWNNLPSLPLSSTSAQPADTALPKGPVSALLFLKKQQEKALKNKSNVSPFLETP